MLRIDPLPLARIHSRRPADPLPWWQTWPDVVPAAVFCAAVVRIFVRVARSSRSQSPIDVDRRRQLRSPGRDGGRCSRRRQRRYRTVLTWMRLRRPSCWCWNRAAGGAPLTNAYVAWCIRSVNCMGDVSLASPSVAYNHVYATFLRHWDSKLSEVCDLIIVNLMC